MSSSASPTTSLTRTRAMAALIVGLLGSLAYWLLIPYQAYYYRIAGLAEDMFAIGVIVFILFVVFGLNLVLRLFNPEWALNFKQIALATAMILAAVVTPGSGLNRMLPYWINRPPFDVSQSKELADAYDAMNLPQALSLFRDNSLLGGAAPDASLPFRLFHSPLGYRVETPLSNWFIRELPAGQSIPWGAWVVPGITWAVFMLFCYLMMVGLGAIVLPQWRRNERLPMTLIHIQEMLFHDPGDRHLLPPIFRRKAFWVGSAIVFVIYQLEGWHQYFPELIPQIPLRYDVGYLFTEPPLSTLPWYIYRFRLYFIFIGMAYFAPPRAAVSIWFFQIGYAIFEMIWESYFPPYQRGAINDHRTGAMIAITVAVLWLGRAHWGRVLRLMVFGAGGADTAPAARADGETKQSSMASFLIVVGLLAVVLLAWTPMGPGLVMILCGGVLAVGAVLWHSVGKEGLRIHYPVALAAFAALAAGFLLYLNQSWTGAVAVAGGGILLGAVRYRGPQVGAVFKPGVALIGATVLAGSVLYGLGAPGWVLFVVLGGALIVQGVMAAARGGGGKAPPGGWFFMGLLVGLSALLFAAGLALHWVFVLLAAALWIRSAVLPKGSEEELRDRRAGVMFMAGVLGMVAFQVWVGVQSAWAFVWVGYAFMFSILLARIVSETGIGHVCFYSDQHQVSVLRLFPVAWFNPVSVWFQGFMGILFSLGGRVCATMMAVEAIGLDPQAKPRTQSRIATLFVVVLMLGVLVSGAVHIHMNYNHKASYDGEAMPLSESTATANWVNYNSHRPLIEHQNGQFNQQVYNQPGHIVFGALLALGLQWACITWPLWPIHPLGLLIVFTGFSNRLFASVFIGWALQRILVRFGGARLYQSGRDFFVGVIMGEVFASIFWIVIPMIRVGMDLEVQNYSPF